jgi:hypothetical protein
VQAPGDGPNLGPDNVRMEYHDGQRQVEHHLKVWKRRRNITSPSMRMSR